MTYYPVYHRLFEPVSAGWQPLPASDNAVGILLTALNSMQHTEDVLEQFICATIPEAQGEVSEVGSREHRSLEQVLLDNDRSWHLICDAASRRGLWLDHSLPSQREAWDHLASISSMIQLAVLRAIWAINNRDYREALGDLNVLFRLAFLLLRSGDPLLFGNGFMGVQKGHELLLRMIRTWRFKTTALVDCSICASIFEPTATVFACADLRYFFEHVIDFLSQFDPYDTTIRERDAFVDKRYLADYARNAWLQISPSRESLVIVKDLMDRHHQPFNPIETAKELAVLANYFIAHIDDNPKLRMFEIWKHRQAYLALPEGARFGISRSPDDIDAIDLFETSNPVGKLVVGDVAYAADQSVETVIPQYLLMRRMNNITKAVIAVAQFVEAKKRNPHDLHELVDKGYLSQPLADPFSGSELLFDANKMEVISDSDVNGDWARTSEVLATVPEQAVLRASLAP